MQRRKRVLSQIFQGESMMNHLGDWIHKNQWTWRWRVTTITTDNHVAFISVHWWASLDSICLIKSSFVPLHCVLVAFEHCLRGHHFSIENLLFSVVSSEKNHRKLRSSFWVTWYFIDSTIHAQLVSIHRADYENVRLTRMIYSHQGERIEGARDRNFAQWITDTTILIWRKWKFRKIF